MAITKTQIETIVDEWVNVLHLEAWTINVEWDEPTDDEARTLISRDYNTAKIRLNLDWKNWNHNKTSEVIAHELLHILFRDLEHIRHLFEGQLDRDVDTVICKFFDHEVEGVIDNLARILVKLYSSSALT